MQKVAARLFRLRLAGRSSEVRYFPGNYSKHVQQSHDALLSCNKDYSTMYRTANDWRKMTQLHKVLNDLDH